MSGRMMTRGCHRFAFFLAFFLWFWGDHLVLGRPFGFGATIWFWGDHLVLGQHLRGLHRSHAARGILGGWLSMAWVLCSVGSFLGKTSRSARAQYARTG
jgi:hypothetical protein